MRAAVIKDINKVEVCDIERPEIKRGHVLLRNAYGGFCGPTEMCIIEGIHPRAKFPLVFCHEFSGIIEETGEDSDFKRGEAVTVNPLISCGRCYACKSGDRHICKNLKLIGIDCDGGFAEYCQVSEENIVRLPEDMSLKSAALSEPVAVGIHAIRNSAFRTGNNTMVFGAGPIGLIVAICLKIAGAGEIMLVEREEKRQALAKSLGFNVVTDMEEFKKDSTLLIDEIFDTTGAPELLPFAVDLVKIKGFIGIVGKFDEPALVNLHDVLFKEITMKGFRVYGEDEFKQAVMFISKNPQYFDRLITDVYDLDSINDAIDAFKACRNLCKIMIKI